MKISSRAVLPFFILICILPSYSHADGVKELFEQKCSKCHTYERALKKEKSIDAWKKTTARMAKYQGSGISPDEAEKIASYLAGKREISAGTISAEPEKKDEKEAGTEEHGIFDFKKVRVEQFIDPSVCEMCHSGIFKQWNGSMHSKAFIDPLWRSATKLFFKEASGVDENLEMKACVKCHTPLGFRSFSISSPGDDYDKLASLPAQGIFCNWCHNISEVKHLGDAGYDVEPGGGEDSPSTMLGPFRDSSSDYHPTKYSELHTRSEFCGLCHNVSHAANGLPIEQTYTEWKNSPYNTGDPKTTVNCQDCHMRQRPGLPSTGKTPRLDNPGQACDGGPQRKHIWTHYFVGANSVVTKMLGSDTHADMAVERLKNAADIKLIRDDSYKKNELSHIRIKVINSGAGHYLPTGLTEVRQMWLYVKITDAEGKVLLSSGYLDDKADIEPNAAVFRTILGNKDGESVLNVAKADRILYDHRIPPKGYALETYSFYIPDNAVSPLKVEAVLKYRSISETLAEALLGGEHSISVIDMAGITEEIGF
ncbi:MAG: cytochrome c554 family protein [Nitrospirae bacterium]|nr:cytochrome c554 family protein [Nitrospirota bacterium]